MIKQADNRAVSVGSISPTRQLRGSKTALHGRFFIAAKTIPCSLSLMQVWHSTGNTIFCGFLEQAV